MTTLHNVNAVEVRNDSAHQPTATFGLGAIAFTGLAVDPLHPNLMNLQLGHPNHSQDGTERKLANTLNRFSTATPTPRSRRYRTSALPPPPKGTVDLVGASGGSATTVDLNLISLKDLKIKLPMND